MTPMHIRAKLNWAVCILAVCIGYGSSLSNTRQVLALWWWRQGMGSMSMSLGKGSCSSSKHWQLATAVEEHFVNVDEREETIVVDVETYDIACYFYCSYWSLVQKCKRDKLIETVQKRNKYIPVIIYHAPIGSQEHDHGSALLLASIYIPPIIRFNNSASFSALVFFFFCVPPAVAGGLESSPSSPLSTRALAVGADGPC